MILIPLLTLTAMPLFKVLPITLQDFNIKAASNVGSHNVFQPKLSENQKSPLNWLSTGKEKKQKTKKDAYDFEYIFPFLHCCP